MTDPDIELDPEERRVKELLVRSASLDAAPPSAKARALEAGLDALAARRRFGFLLGAGGAVTALAAGALLWLGGRADEQPAPKLAPEPPPPVLAPKPPAEPVRPACPQLVVARGDARVLDDFERHDSRVLPLDGRGGDWITYDDGTGKQLQPDKSPLFPARIAGGRGSSQRGLHVAGGKFKDWGVTVVADLANGACYDASAYRGVEFWAKGPGVVKFGFQIIDVQERKFGGFCKTNCYNAHRKVLELTNAWQHFEIPWEELRQLYEAGPPLTFDPRRIRAIELAITPDDTPFDFWLDDVAFLER